MYFRDGVSEGQYAQIIAEELRDLKTARKTLQDTYELTVTVVTYGTLPEHVQYVPEILVLMELDMLDIA